MPSKKSTTNKERTKPTRKSRVISIHDISLPKDFQWTPNGTASGDELHPYRMRRNPEPSPEAEAKRLARRKALTLRAFQTTYDNHHRRKAS